MKKRAKKFIFFQSIPPYRSEVLVCAGITLEETKAYAKKEVAPVYKKEYLEWLDSHEEQFELIAKKKMLGFSLIRRETGDLLLILEDYRDEWWYWECLIHELHHLVEYISEMKMLDGEIEAKAYLQEWLFHSIRRKLQKVDKLS